MDTARIDFALLTAAGPPGSTRERWAQYVMRACQSDRDLRTLAMWAKYLGVSFSTLSEICRLIGIRPHEARDFARVLRALIRSHARRVRPDTQLDVSDRRTLKSLELRAHVTLTEPAGDGAVENFLQCQRFIPPGNDVLDLVRDLLRESAVM